MNKYEKAHISQVIELSKSILVLPATNASSERSFSLLWLVKSYLRATTGQGGLNHLMKLSLTWRIKLERCCKGVYPEKRQKNIIIWEDINVLTHFFPIFSLRFKTFKPYNFCSSKYGQYYMKHKISYLLKHTRRCGAFQELSNFILLETCWHFLWQKRMVWRF